MMDKKKWMYFLIQDHDLIKLLASLSAMKDF